MFYSGTFCRSIIFTTFLGISSFCFGSTDSSIRLAQSLKDIPRIFEQHAISNVIEPIFFTNVCKNLILCHEEQKILNTINPSQKTKEIVNTIELLMNATTQALSSASKTFKNENNESSNKQLEQNNALIAQLIASITAANTVVHGQNPFYEDIDTITKIKNRIPFLIKSASFAFITIAVCYVATELLRWYLGEELLLQKITILKELSEQLVIRIKDLRTGVGEVKENQENICDEVQASKEAVERLQKDVADKSQLLKNDERLAKSDVAIFQELKKIKEENETLKKTVENLDAYLIRNENPIELGKKKKGKRKLLFGKNKQSTSSSGMTRKRSSSDIAGIAKIKDENENPKSTHKRSKSKPFIPRTDSIMNLRDFINSGEIAPDLEYQPPEETANQNVGRRRSHTTATECPCMRW